MLTPSAPISKTRSPTGNVRSKKPRLNLILTNLGHFLILPLDCRPPRRTSAPPQRPPRRTSEKATGVSERAPGGNCPSTAGSRVVTFCYLVAAGGGDATTMFVRFRQTQTPQRRQR